MAPLWFVPAGALCVVFFYVLTIWARHVDPARRWRETVASVMAAAFSVVAGITLYAVAGWVADEWPWRNVAAACFVAFPLVSVVTLNVAVRRAPRMKAGSSLGAAVASAIAVAALGGWAAYSWRGPRGNWEAHELLVFAVSVITLFAGSSCFGWWCGGKVRQENG